MADYLVLRSRGDRLCSLAIESEAKRPYEDAWRVGCPILCLNHVLRRYKTAHLSGELFAVSAAEMKAFIRKDSLISKYQDAEQKWLVPLLSIGFGTLTVALFLIKVLLAAAATLVFTLIVLSLFKESR